MAKKQHSNNPRLTAELRSLVEERLKHRQTSAANLSSSPEEMLRLVNELNVRQVVVEMQLEELVRTKTALEESDRLKTSFLANISHEILIPMNGILGFSELLKDPHLTREEQNEYIELIHQSGQRMLTLINDLMDISKIDAREVKLKESETSVNQLLRDLLAFSKLEADQKGLRLSSTAGLPDNESIITTDSGKLTQILTNLIQNALQFTSKGGIDIGYCRKEKMLEFYVIDSGIGIPADKKGEIFERFHQADNSLTLNHGGSGLGLSISKAFVEMLGGTISVVSVEGAGSTFSFSLPYKPAGRAQGSSDAKPDAADSAPGFCILIAEDDDLSTLLLKKNLKGENITILCAENGWKAVELVQHHPEINLVLMDIKMPVMNGFEATKLIKQQRPDLSVIVQTALTSPYDREKAQEAGCDAFIRKPIERRKLFELMKEANNFANLAFDQPQTSLQHTKEFSALSLPKKAQWTLARDEWLLTMPDGHKVKLTSKEFDFMIILISRNKKVLERREFAQGNSVSVDEFRSGALEALVHRLRRKTSIANSDSPIKTIHGIGYSFTGEITVI